MTRNTSILIVVMLARTAAAQAPAPTPAPTPAPAPAPAATPAATPADASPRALVIHVPPLVVDAAQPIELVAQIDAPFAEALTARWRTIDNAGAAWQDVVFERSSAGGWFAALPAALPPGVAYYIRGRDAAGVEVDHFASEQAPHVVRVVPSLVDRLEVLDRQRTGDRRNEISLDVIGHDFGNRYDLRDRFVRAELAYSRRLLRELHSVTFGFGSISGTTPVMSLPEDLGGDDVGRSLRYGFGEVRLRAHPSVFFDLRGSLGASHDGFTGGARGAVTFGKPWRSSVTFGGEYLGDVGPSAWVRLQWDTAPPLLMGASVVRTDLPGALISSAGLYLAYDIAYRIAGRATVRGQLSYGARDGASHLGGGLGTAIEF